MILNEINQMIMLGSGGLCFAIGGTGYKWVRRFALPIIFATVCWVSGLLWYRSMIMALCYMIVFSLPYGDKESWVERFVVGILYALPSLIFGKSIWMYSVSLIFISLFWLSRKNKVVWKIVEFGTGAIIAVSLIMAK